MGLKYVQTAQYPGMCRRLGGVSGLDPVTACRFELGPASTVVDVEGLYMNLFGGCDSPGTLCCGTRELT